MSSRFQDHFSSHAPDYVRFRPTYPAALFAAIAGAAPGRDAAWDAGCGNGQASCALADHFGRVEASDASAEQLRFAIPHPRVHYQCTPAEAPALADHSVDAIIVAQALHWFRFDAFYAAVRRVGRPGSLIVAFMYDLATIAPDIDRIIHAFYRGDIGPFWPGDRRHIDSGYRSIPWPFEPVMLTSPPMQCQWSLDALMGYLGTWSAVNRFVTAGHADPLPALRAQLLPHWGSPDQPRTVSWPLHLLAGRVH